MTLAGEKSPLVATSEAIHDTSRDGILSAMVSVAPPGLSDLPPAYAEPLTTLTCELVDRFGAASQAEYDRYNNVAHRGLTVDSAALSERIAGKSVLVTGGTGLIGSQLIKKLTDYSPGRLVSVARGETRPWFLTDGVDYRKADVRDGNRIHEIFQEVQPDVVFHVAADKYNQAAEFRVHHTLSTNILGTRNVIQAAAGAGVGHFTYASTGKAARPYSPDVYASSKKTGEWLLARAAEESDMATAAVRFTHVVDDSNVRRKIHERIAANQPVHLQSPETLMYIQSAGESADLLMNASLDARPDVLTLAAIRNLSMPINLTDLGVGALAKTGARLPIYFTGVQVGYEDKAWPCLYDPLNAGDVTPLFCSLESAQAESSAHCDDVDIFPLQIADTQELRASFSELSVALEGNATFQELRDLNHQVSWDMLDARLHAMPLPHLGRAAHRAANVRSPEGVIRPEHEAVNARITAAYQARS